MTQRPELPIHPCVAARSAMECEREGCWLVVAGAWTCFVCERHRRLVEVKLEREGLTPRFVEVHEPSGTPVA